MPEVNPFDGPEWEEYEDRIKRELIPMIETAAASITVITPDRANVKFAVELGFSIMFDKPLIVIVTPGAKLPPKLPLIADEIIEGEPTDPDFQQRFVEAMTRVTKSIERGKQQLRDGGGTPLDEL